MKPFCYILFMMFEVMVACTKSSSNVDTVISAITSSATSISADGSSTITLSVTLNPNSDTDKRNVLFTASDGSFVNGKDSTISQKAIFLNEQLYAQVTYKAPVKAGTVMITAHPDIASYFDLVRTLTIDAKPSGPAKIKLTPGGFSVHFGFTGEDTVIGKITNADGAGVSVGTKVVFEDSFVDNASWHGRFRAGSNSSNASAQVSAYHSPGFIAPVGSNFYIRATVLDATGAKTNIKDSVLLTVIQ